MTTPRRTQEVANIVAAVPVLTIVPLTAHCVVLIAVSRKLSPMMPPVVVPLPLTERCVVPFAAKACAVVAPLLTVLIAPSRNSVESPVRTFAEPLVIVVAT